MANELVAFENMLTPLKPHFEQALAGVMPVERLMRSIMISVEKTPKLLECSKQSLINSAMTAAMLGLEPDGVTAQSYILPFKGQAQLVIGYKGYATLAARSGFTINGEVVRDGDAFDYMLGDAGFVRHKPKLGNTAPIIAAWATASAIGRPPIICVLGIDDIMAIKNKSPGAKRGESPWNDPAIGFPAMASKSAKRRLGRSMPLNVMQLAAALDEAHEERGRHAWIDPRKGLQIEGEVAPMIEDRGITSHDEQRGAEELLGPRIDKALEAGRAKAALGMAELETWWKTATTKADRDRLMPTLENELKPIARAADKASLASSEPQSGQIHSPQGMSGAAVPTSFKAPTTAAEYLDVAHARIKADPVAARAWYEASGSAREFLGVTGDMIQEITDHLNERK